MITENVWCDNCSKSEKILGTLNRFCENYQKIKSTPCEEFIRKRLDGSVPK